MGLNGDFYRLLLVLHIVAAVIGFGTMFAAGFYGLAAKASRGKEAQAIAEATYKVTTTVGEWAIYAVPLLGILLILTSDDTWKFSQVWISLSFLVYVGALGLVHGVHLPNIRQMNALLGQLAAGPQPGAGGPPPQVAELEARGKKAGLVGGILNVAWVLVVFLMVFKPGL